MKSIRFDIVDTVGKFEPGDIIQNKDGPQTGYIKESKNGNYLIGWFRCFGDEHQCTWDWLKTESCFVKIGKLDRNSPKIKVTEIGMHEISQPKVKIGVL